MTTAAFPKILHIGDKQLSTLFDGEVEITEKVDGSQLGFGKVNGELFVRSKGKEQDLDNPDMMFIQGVEHVKTISSLIPDNFTLYGEYLQKPKHNTLAYDRIPNHHIAIFGVYNQETREFYDYDTITEWAEKLKVDAIPLLFRGKASPEMVLEMVKEKVSYFGGQNIEGVVVKAYKPWLFLNQIPLSVMSGKYVTEAFKEVHNKSWKAENTGKGKLEVAISQYRSEARWNKAVQHLRDNGQLTGSPRDIGELIKEVRKDISEEEKEAIKASLWSIFKNDFLGHATSGLPEWYKEKLVVGEINEPENAHGVQLPALPVGEGQTDSQGVSTNDETQTEDGTEETR